MAQKGSKKRFINIDEEKDIFLSSLNKKIRNARKKIEQIEDLEKKDKSTLKPEQLEKIRSRAEVIESIKYNESLKDMYYAAFKTAQEEGKLLPQQESQVARKVTEEDKTEVAQPKTVEEPKQQVAVEPVRTQEDNSRIIRDTLSKVLNLVHFAQLFRDQSSVQAFRQAYEAHRDQFSLESVPDFESFHEFFVKVFTFSESDRFGKVADKINGSLGELESYINAAEQPALRNKTYRHLQNVVENVAKSAFFRDRNAEVEAPKARSHTEPSAIGSELRKAPEHQEAPVVRSPEKETRAQPEAATKTAEKAAPQEETRKDWGALEDEEEEEAQEQEEIKGEAEEEEEEQPAKKEEQKTDDGFISVKPKYKEKKEETGYRGSGTRPYRGGRGGNRGGERGGYRREGEEGYRPRPRRDEGQEAGENQGEGQGEGRRGGYRGRGEGRGGRGGYRGRGEGRGGRGGYRREGEQREQQGERQPGSEIVRTENA